MEPNQLIGQDTMNAPLGLQSRCKLVMCAATFFNPSTIVENHTVIGKKVKSGGSPEPLSVSDFLKYLEVKKVFQKMPNAFRVAQIVKQIESCGLLIHAGSTPSFGGLGDCYLYVALESDARRHLFRFVPVLGPEFLYNLCKPGLVHITGTNDNGDAVAGTGFVGHASYIITCRHVVNDMTINEKQIFQDREYSVDLKSIYAHSDVDVAVIHVDGPALQPVQGTAFQAPVVAQTVYTLGYPKLPGLRDASVTMQQGAVTNESVTALSGESLFLYSAISRPGNSGGPVMSQDGYVVGLSVVDARGQYHPDEAFSPHYAGIPAQVVVKAVEDLGLGIQLPFEGYE